MQISPKLPDKKDAAQDIIEEIMAATPSAVPTSNPGNHDPNTRDNCVAFNGTTLNIDHAAYISQHDVVYGAPPASKDAMGLGDGDLGAALWCPGRLYWQLQKTDLWEDPPPGRNGVPIKNPDAWSMLAAGGISIGSQPALLEAPTKYEQRLSLYSAVATIESESPSGSCQVTSFVSEDTGVLVIDYHDQTLKNTARWIEVDIWRTASVFALGDSIGVMQGLRDRRYAMVARVQGRNGTSRMVSGRTARIDIEPSRSCNFTIYVAVATTPKDGDPVMQAKSQINRAMEMGYDALLKEHRKHWAGFWQRSFVCLTSATDPLAAFAENLWYLHLYNSACCATGSDAALVNGANMLTAGDRRDGSATYALSDIQHLIAPMLATNHVELTVPAVDTLNRVLPQVAATTSQEDGVPGAMFPPRFNRFGHPFKTINSSEVTAAPECDATRIADGLRICLLLWEAYRYAPDPEFLSERVYCILRATAEAAIEKATEEDWMSIGVGQSMANLPIEHLVLCLLHSSIQALLWASKELQIDEDRRLEWHSLCAQLHERGFVESERRSSAEIDDRVAALRKLLRSKSINAQGWFTTSGNGPNLRQGAQFVTSLTKLLLKETPPVWDLWDLESSHDHLVTGILDLGSEIPATWNAAYALAAPGGFRVCAEARRGVLVYAAVRSLLGSTCRMYNPWGAGKKLRITFGRTLILESAEALVEWPTERHGVYLIEQCQHLLARTVRIKLTGRKNAKAKQFGENELGIAVPQRQFLDAAEANTKAVSQLSRLRRQ